MRQWLRLRDGKCPFPGCNNPSLDNDADHLLAWADGGTTGITNLGQPCRKHHRLKHRTAWTPTGASKDDPPGWISPSGRTLPQRAPGLGTTPLAAVHHRDGLPAQPRIAHRPGTRQQPESHPEEEPGRDPGPELPPDPFPDWYAFTGWHDFPTAEAPYPHRSAAMETTLVGRLLQPA